MQCFLTVLSKIKNGKHPCADWSGKTFLSVVCMLHHSSHLLVQVVPLSEAPPPKGIDCGVEQEKSLLGHRTPGGVQTNTAVAGSIILPGHCAFLGLFYSSLQNRSDPDLLSRDEEHRRALCINTLVILIPHCCCRTGTINKCTEFCTVWHHFLRDWIFNNEKCTSDLIQTFWLKIYMLCLKSWKSMKTSHLRQLLVFLVMDILQTPYFPTNFSEDCDTQFI